MLLGVELRVREQRRRLWARKGRRRLALAAVAALLLHLLALPVLIRATSRGEAPEPEVALVRIPASHWDAALAEGRRAASESERLPAERRERAKVEREEPRQEEAPGQVVEVAPGNQEEAPDARFAAESSNRVERETVARDRRAGHPVTMPKTTVDTPTEPLPGEQKGGEAIASLGTQDTPDVEEEAGGRRRIEIPSTERRDAVSLRKQEGTGRGPSLRNQERSDAVAGNSDRFLLELGEGEGEGEGAGSGAGSGAGGKGLNLFPSGAAIGRIVGGPAPDHIEGVDEGEGTFLNTREWRHASFFNRVKRAVSLTWDPNTVLRARDPSGKVYAWKDRYTLVSVTLRSDGSLVDVFVEQSSGVDFLDREAVSAFERAQPFPNPPRAMLDESGTIRFGFGFHVYSESTMRVFRRY